MLCGPPPHGDRKALLLFIGATLFVLPGIEFCEGNFLRHSFDDLLFRRSPNDVPNVMADLDGEPQLERGHFPNRPPLSHFRDGASHGLEDGMVEVPSVRHTPRGDVLSKTVVPQAPYIQTFGGGDRPQMDGVGSPKGPYFDPSLPRNLTVQTGKTAVLSCRVLNRDEKTVSWIRLHDLHILTVDKYKYSTDQRVSVVYNEANKEWVLRILGAKHSDGGKYECQVSTKPVLSYIVDLTIVDDISFVSSTSTPFPSLSDEIPSGNLPPEVPRAHILNSPDIYVHRGSLINLTCVVTHGTDQPVFIYWHHYNQLVDIEDRRRNVEVGGEVEGKTVSHLLVKEATFDDSGKYTCKPSNGEDATVTLHILNGELQQAMQTNESALLLASSMEVVVLSSFAILLSSIPVGRK